MPTQLAYFAIPHSPLASEYSHAGNCRRNPGFSSAETLQEEVALCLKYDLTTAGVIDQDDKLLGMITVDDVMEVAREEFEEDVLRLGGVGKRRWMME